MRVETIGAATLYLGDCAEIIPTLGHVDACVTDPPYGINMDGGNVGYKGFNDFEKLDWDASPPSKALFNSLFKLSDDQIFWGGNYFELPPTRCVLVWDKGAGFKDRTYAEAELAWTSLDQNVRVFLHDPLARGDYKGKHHPTQKPLLVMDWCLSFLPKANTILDPFMGSGTTGVAAVKAKKQFIGIEKHEPYFDICCRRLAEAQKQEGLF